jgi:hypothetical protein
MRSEIRSAFISVSYHSHLPLLIILATTFTLLFKEKYSFDMCAGLPLAYYHVCSIFIFFL